MKAVQEDSHVDYDATPGGRRETRRRIENVLSFEREEADVYTTSYSATYA